MEDVDPRDVDLINQLGRTRLVRVCRALDLNPAYTVFFVERGGLHGDVGRYIDGTSSQPVIGLDLQAIMDFAEEYAIHWLTQVEATIAHELAHAFQDSAGLSRSEKRAEAFARKWTLEGIADVSILSKSHGLATRGR
jgi:hypothetical protein